MNDKPKINIAFFQKICQHHFFVELFNVILFGIKK
jgi:hypothetical protein